MKIYSTNHANLNTLIQTEVALSVEDLTAFQNLLLGALSVEVDPTVWKECIETSLAELLRVRRYNARKTQVD